VLRNSSLKTVSSSQKSKQNRNSLLAVSTSSLCTFRKITCAARKQQVHEEPTRQLNLCNPSTQSIASALYWETAANNHQHQSLCRMIRSQLYETQGTLTQ